MIEYKGYYAEPKFSEEDACFYGRLLGIRDIVSFEGSTVEELIQDFHLAVDDYIDMCRSRGEDPQTPYSGEVFLRIEPNVHVRAAHAASRQNKSLNQYINDLLKREVG